MKVDHIRSLHHLKLTGVRGWAQILAMPIRVILISFRLLETPRNSLFEHREHKESFFFLFLWCNVTTSKECQFLAFVAALDIGWSHDNNRFHKFMVMYCALYRGYLINNYWSFKAAFLALFSQYYCGIGICAILGL